ncbi:hypothetical protein MKX03_035969, partial [Papaver bracteatum]
HQGRNSNRKSGNSIKSGSGGVLNDSQSIVSDPINKWKGKMVITNNDGSRKSDGGHQKVSTNSLSSLSKTIGGFLEGGRSSCSKIPGGAASNDQPLDRNSDREDHTCGLKASIDGGHCTNEKVDESSFSIGGACSGATGMECIFGKSQSGIDFVKIFPFKLDLHGSG